MDRGFQPESGQRERDLRLLQFVFDHDQGLTCEPAPVGELRDLAGGENAYALTMRRLQHRGLVIKDDRLSSGYHISADGAEEVERLRERQQDWRRRRTGCREQLLQHLAHHHAAGVLSRIPRATFHGSLDLVEFLDDEIFEAADYLCAQGLVQSIDMAEEAHVMLWLTRQGRECVESGASIADHVQARFSRSATGHVVSVTGDGNVIAGAFGDHSTASATVERFDPQQALRFAAVLRQALPALSALDAAEAEALLAAIEDQPESPRARKATERLYTMLADTSSGALGETIAALAASVLGIG